LTGVTVVIRNGWRQHDALKDYGLSKTIPLHPLGSKWGMVKPDLCRADSQGRQSQRADDRRDHP
jgi:hypothetical protein